MRIFGDNNYSGRSSNNYEGKRSNRSRNRSDKPQMYDAVCDECGKDCKVPFKPSGNKPIYCSECFEKRGGGRDRDNRSGRRDYNRGRKDYNRGSRNTEMFSANILKDIQCYMASL